MAKIPTPRFTLKNPHGPNSLVYLIFRYRTHKLRYSTQVNIALEDWDKKTQRPVAKERRPDLWAIRRTLENIAEQTTAIYIEHNYGALSKDAFKDHLDVRLNRVVPEQTIQKEIVPFFTFMDRELKEMEATGMKKGSLKMFKLHVGILKKFAKAKGKFCYEDVNWHLRLKLIDWLSTRDIQLAYGNKTLNVLRQFMERARRKGYHNSTAYQGQGWQVRPLKAEGEKIILTTAELSRLASMSLTGHHKKIRDILLIGCGTGQRFSDFSKLTKQQFYTSGKGVPLLSLISQKTATRATIPLTIFPWLVPVLEEYDYTVPAISMQKFNEGLKSLCKAAEVDEQVLVVKQCMGRKPRIQKRYTPKYEVVSSHLCRRSFATNLYRMGYSLAQIMPMTGHSTETQLRLYIGIDAEQNAENIGLQMMEERKAVA